MAYVGEGVMVIYANVAILDLSKTLGNGAR